MTASDAAASRWRSARCVRIGTHDQLFARKTRGRPARRRTEGLGRIFDERCDLRKPRGALLSGATRHRRIHASHDAADAAQTEDAVLPERFKWIAERRGLTLGQRIGSVDDYRKSGP